MSYTRHRPGKSIAEYVEELHGKTAAGIELDRERDRACIAYDKAQKRLAAHLRNLEVLIAELRGVIDAGGAEVTTTLLDTLGDTCGELEESLSDAVAGAAQSAGLVPAGSAAPAPVGAPAGAREAL